MALLTAEEKAKLAKEGIAYGVKEKCDGCGAPFLEPSSYIIHGKVYCKKCRDQIKGQKFSKKREEKEMARNNKKAGKEEKNGGNKVGGYLIAESCVADLYLALEDEKRHPLSEVKKIASKHKSELTSRLGRLRRVGLKKKAWAIIVDKENGTVQMKLGTPPKDGGSDKKAKRHHEEEDEKPSKKSKANGKAHDDDAGESTSESTSKAQRVAATIIRRALKSKKDWTRNKLTEHLVDDEGLDSDVVRAALNHEIKSGGIEVEDGILSLA